MAFSLLFTSVCPAAKPSGSVLNICWDLAASHSLPCCQPGQRCSHSCGSSSNDLLTPRCPLLARNCSEAKLIFSLSSVATSFTRGGNLTPPGVPGALPRNTSVTPLYLPTFCCCLPGPPLSPIILTSKMSGCSWLANHPSITPSLSCTLPGPLCAKRYPLPCFSCFDSIGPRWHVTCSVLFFGKTLE